MHEGVSLEPREDLSPQDYCGARFKKQAVKAGLQLDGRRVLRQKTQTQGAPGLGTAQELSLQYFIIPFACKIQNGCFRSNTQSAVMALLRS